MNMPTVHIEGIKEHGYTDSEARFLYIVAVFSGYFTLKQFLAFAGIGYGKRHASFAQKLLKKGHATVRDYLRRCSIYHLFSRSIYGQIEKDILQRILGHSEIGMTMRYVKIAEHYKVEAVEKMEKYRAVKMQEAEANLGMLQ